MGNFLGCSCEEKGDTPLFEIKKNRGCTDVPFLLAFVALWGLIVVMLGKANGDPMRLTYGTDWNGNVCGITPGFTAKPLAAWPLVPLSTEATNLMKTHVCIASCNQTQTDRVFRGTLLQAMGYKSTQVLKFCIPADPRFAAAAGGASNADMAARAFGDLYVTYNLIGYSAIIAVVLAFFYIWFCKRFAGVLIWATILVVALGGLGIGVNFLNSSKDTNLASTDPGRVKTLQYMAYGAFGITAVFVLVVFALRKRIKIAVEVVKEAAKAVGDMTMMVFFPLVPFAISIAYFCFWIYGALNLFSVQIKTLVPAADIDSNLISIGSPAMITINKWDPAMQNFFAIHFFHLLWNVQFLVYFAYMVIAGCVAQWYFTPYKDNGKKPRGNGDGELPHAAVRHSVWRAVRFHLGTIAFGSLLIAIVQFIRAVITYMTKTAKGMKDNKVKQAILCVTMCCLKLLQCCLDKLSKNAFVYCAIYGDPFCTSAWTSFAILWRNLARVAAINMVGTYISILGKLLVSFGTSAIAVQLMLTSAPWVGNVSSPILTAFIVLIMGYLIASIFMVVYETAVDTIFLCFLIDEEQNKNGQMLASKTLVEIINRYQQKAEIVATTK